MDNTARPLTDAPFAFGCIVSKSGKINKPLYSLCLDIYALAKFVLTGYLRSRQIRVDWHFIPSSAFKDSSCSFLLNPSPLLEEKWDFGPQALISNISDPFLHDRSCAWTGLA